MIKRTIRGYYGINNPETNILIYGDWYAVEGSMNINKASHETEFYDGMSVETIQDVDTITSDYDPVYTVDDVANHVDEYEASYND